MNITRFQSNILKIRKNSSVLDFGSGNGAFLFYFLNKFKLNKNLSFEVSQPLISLQKKFINKTTFYKVHQSKDNFSEKYKKIRVDHSYCNSVFQYFVNENYALKVIEFLMNITNKSIFQEWEIFKKLFFYEMKTYNISIEYCELLCKTDLTIAYHDQTKLMIFVAFYIPSKERIRLIDNIEI